MEEIQPTPEVQPVQAPKSPLKFDKINTKKVLPVLGAVIVALAVVGGAVYYFFPQGDPGDDYGCLKMLPSPYCSTGKTITYQGETAIGYDLPAGVEIRAPFLVTYLDDNPTGYPEPIWMRLGILETSSSINIATYYDPAVEDGASVEEGGLIGTTVEPGEPFSTERQSNNFIIRISHLEIEKLFES